VAGQLLPRTNSHKETATIESGHLDSVPLPKIHLVEELATTKATCVMLKRLPQKKGLPMVLSDVVGVISSAETLHLCDESNVPLKSAGNSA